MASFSVPYLVGNTYKRDHQYFQTVTREELMIKMFGGTGIDPNPAQHQSNLRQVDRGWPVAVDLKTIQQLSWRVRHWRVSAGSYSFEGTARLGGVHYTWDVSWPEFTMLPKRLTDPHNPFDEVDNPLVEIENERDLLGGNFAPPFTLRNEGFGELVDFGDGVTSELIPNTDNGIPSAGDPRGTAGAGLLGALIIYDPDTKLFYPRISFSGFAFESTDIHTLDVFSFSGNPIASPPEVQQGTLTVVCPWGSNLTISIGMEGRASPGIPDIGTGSATVVMTPIKWWPYNKAGLPVYDEDTGEPL